jgi:putative membrane protein
MGYLTVLLRVFLLVVFFLFAQKNYEPATLRFYFDLEWRAPLILMLLLFFVLGVVLTLLALLPRLLRMRRLSARSGAPPGDAAQ